MTESNLQKVVLMQRNHIHNYFFYFTTGKLIQGYLLIIRWTTLFPCLALYAFQTIWKIRIQRNFGFMFKNHIDWWRWTTYLNNRGNAGDFWTGSLNFDHATNMQYKNIKVCAHQDVELSRHIYQSHDRRVSYKTACDVRPTKPILYVYNVVSFVYPIMM